ncbi:MAG: hypothetical protein LBD04_07905 [Synergistaceae bacterium]|nr:hypothetical protein [Synergistaceae bacterium]
MKVFSLYSLKCAVVSIYFFSALFLWGGVALAAISADDFLPPAQADGAEKAALLAVKDEAAVKTEADPVLNAEVTTAPNLQDAINKVIEKPKTGCRIIAEPSGGYAFVATGQASYKADHQNVTASRVAQRNAYVEAYMTAKSEMAKTAGEIVARGADGFDKKIETLDTEARALRNVESELTESQLQTVRKVLKGYVTYAALDNGKGTVYVTVVSTSKTRGKFSRSGTDGVSASSLKDGLNAVIAEIKNGFVPPVGGRIIEVPETGEVAFVGFGSSVVRYDPETDVQEELKLQAERVAGLRATDALVGILLGDDTRWTGHADESTVQQVKDFERQQASDQTTKGSDSEINAYDQRKRAMLNSLSEGFNIQNLRQGTLPPGVIRETSLDDDEYFAYGIAVYVPSLSDAARGAAKEMDEAQLVQPPKPGGPAVGGSTPEKEQPPIKQGPSGVVEQDL